MLTRIEFEILRDHALDFGQAPGGPPCLPPQSRASDRQAAAQNLNKLGFLKAGAITPEGMRALEPYRVDNAILLAAGMSSRFLPLSLERPKGLLTVKGERMIERQIRQLREAGIRDITVVLGYMHEKFEYLKDQYGVRLVVNEEYLTKNNTSSLMLTLDQ